MKNVNLEGVETPHITRQVVASVPRVSAVVPAYNEAGRIGNVIRVLCQVKSLSEIVVVDDGSTDRTAAEALDAARNDGRLRVVTQPRNQGKGQAVFTGWQLLDSPFFLMLDADLVHLKPEHVEKLMEPVLEGQADMTIGQFCHAYWRTDWAHSLTPWLSGQRCLRTELMAAVPSHAAAGYGLETALSLAARKGHWQVKYIPLAGVTHPLGELPRGGYHGLRTKMKMFAQVARAWWLYYRSLG